MHDISTAINTQQYRLYQSRSFTEHKFSFLNYEIVVFPRVTLLDESPKDRYLLGTGTTIVAYPEFFYPYAPEIQSLDLASNLENMLRITFIR